MTEAEWSTWSSYDASFRRVTGIGFMLDQPPHTSRKRRLFGCACLRRAWDLLTDPRCQTAVEVAERFADGRATNEELATAEAEAGAAVEAMYVGPRFSRPGAMPPRQEPQSAEWWVASASFLLTASQGGNPFIPVPGRVLGALEQTGLRTDVEVAAWLCAAARDIFGNPFRPASYSPDWRTSTAVSLAKAMYDSRDFSAMPILADALRDAGCDNDDILNHCRDANGIHVRGCWVVDLVLGKE